MTLEPKGGRPDILRDAAVVARSCCLPRGYILSSPKWEESFCPPLRFCRGSSYRTLSFQVLSLDDEGPLSRTHREIS